MQSKYLLANPRLVIEALATARSNYAIEGYNMPPFIVLVVSSSAEDGEPRE
jgi:hypothetical protein